METVKRHKRHDGRRAEDPHYQMAVNGALGQPLKAKDTKGLLTRLIWERAKGELRGVIAICRTEPQTPRCAEVENKAMDLIMGLEAVIYGWTEEETQSDTQTDRKRSL